MRDRQKEFKDVYKKYSLDLIKHLERMDIPSNEGWDLVQDSIIRYLCLGKKKRSNITRPFGYLIKTVTRLAIRKLKQQKWRYAQDKMYNASRFQRSHDLKIEAADVLKEIWKKIDVKGKLVMQSMTREDLNAAGISSSTGLACSTVKRRIKKINRLAQKIT